MQSLIAIIEPFTALPWHCQSLRTCMHHVPACPAPRSLSGLKPPFLI
jgi:hypothetical protein